MKKLWIIGLIAAVIVGVVMVIICRKDCSC